MAHCHEYNECVKEWMTQKRKEMILCPNQPGYMKISKDACIKRYLTAKEMPFEKISKNDPFYYILKSGMDRCISCPIGRRYASLTEEDETEETVAI
jgi:hypothetical protein